MALAAGNILEGTVVNITNFGAFVEVEGNVAGTYIEGDITVTYKYKKIKKCRQ